MLTAFELRVASIAHHGETCMQCLSEQGIDFYLKVLGFPYYVVDKEGDYELWWVQLWHDGTWGRYLRMKNPSTGQFHLEGVPNSITTVKGALEWRNHGWFSHPDTLT
jgi:hypothetical protein